MFRRLFSDWKLTTVRTFLSRLVEKGYLRTEVPIEVLLEAQGPRKREVIDYLEGLVGDRDRAVEVVVSAAHRPSVAYVADDGARAAEVAKKLASLGATASTREGTARFVPTLTRAEALDEETTSFFDYIARDDPQAYDRIIERAAERKALIRQAGRAHGADRQPSPQGLTAPLGQATKTASRRYAGDGARTVGAAPPWPPLPSNADGGSGHGEATPTTTPSESSKLSRTYTPVTRVEAQVMQGQNSFKTLRFAPSAGLREKVRHSRRRNRIEKSEFLQRKTASEMERQPLENRIRLNRKSQTPTTNKYRGSERNKPW